jgi:hypothetical protein
MKTNLLIRLGRTVLLLLITTTLFTSCYNLKVGSGGTCQSEYNDASTFWKDVKYQDKKIRMKNLSETIQNGLCPETCICRVEYKVTFGQALVATVTLGFVRNVNIRYACCQASN